MKPLIFFVFAACLACSCSNKTPDNKSKKTKQGETNTTTESKTGLKIKDKIAGDWQLVSVSGVKLTASEKTAVFTINADGSGFSGNKEAKMQWSLTEEDGKSYLIIKSEDDDRELLEIKSIEDNKLVMLEKREGKINELILIRKLP
jgi:hypothetical protein